MYVTDVATLLGSVLNRDCPHQFSWPYRLPTGGYYQVCERCGDQYLYDWATMTRGGNRFPSNLKQVRPRLLRGFHVHRA